MEHKLGLACATLNNYGSLLQTYALQTVISKEGIDSQIIKYHEPIARKIRRMKDWEYLKISIKKFCLNKIPFLGGKVNKKNLVERAERFEDFRKKYLQFSEACNNRSELTSLASSYKMVMLGSDQLWQPMNLLMDFYTLTFVPDVVIKASYAASFGVSEIPKRMEDVYKRFISRFDYLSCREEAGAALVEKLTGRKAQVVCDPTLLITAKGWESALSDKVKYEEAYIFCYFLGANENHRTLAKQWSEKTGLKIVALPHVVEYVACDEKYADDLPYHVGPSEFLYLIKNASYVFTDSFHASVFSLQFHKQFFVFDRFENHKGRTTTSRIDTLLAVVNQEKRLVKHRACIDDIIALGNVDFSQIDERLEDFRIISYKYLQNVLQGILPKSVPDNNLIS